MSAEDFHKILEPYLWSAALVIVILAATAVLLRRHGRKARAADGPRQTEGPVAPP